MMRSIDGRESVGSFEELRLRSPVLAPFGGAAEVAAFLVNKGSGLGERDRVLRCLVDEARRGRAKQIALALLLLGLWPGLDAIVRKRRPLFQPRAHDVELEIIDRFIGQVQRIELARVSCLAATLVLNTEREVVDARVRERAWAAKCGAVVPDALAAPGIEEALPSASPFGLSFGQSDAEDVATLRAWLWSAIGSDAALVVDAVIHGKSRLELAASLGISHAAARKRLERALGRARHAFRLQHASQPGAAPALVN